MGTLNELVQALARAAADPTRWAAAARDLPVWAAVAAAAAGLLGVVAGGGRAFRLLAGPLGAVLGLAWTTPVLRVVAPALVGPTGPVVTAAVLALAGFAFPQAVTALAVGVPAALLGAHVAGPGDALLGFLPGLVLGGALGVWLHRTLAVVLASAAGAVLLCVALLAGARVAGLPGVSAEAAARPWALLAFAGVVALAGIGYQLSRRGGGGGGAKKKAPGVGQRWGRTPGGTGRR